MADNMATQRERRKLQQLALNVLEALTDVERFEALFACLGRIDQGHAQRIREGIDRRGGLSDSTGLSVIVELFCQRSAISFAADCVEHVIGRSAFKHEGASDLIAKVREWIAGHISKKEVVSVGEEVAEEAREWERKWYAWYNTIPLPLNKRTQHEIDSSQEPLFVYDSALAAAAATQCSERSRGNQLGHHRKWFDSVNEALSRSLEAVARRAPRGGKRQRKMVETENQWRVPRLASFLGNAEPSQDGFAAEQVAAADRPRE